MILRNYKGREKSVGKQQMHSGFLLIAVKKISNEFPILREARREVFEETGITADYLGVLGFREQLNFRFG
jgi:Lhr-like helicase